MNISEMRANEDALGDETATAALSSKIGSIWTRTLTSIFSKTMLDRAKRFSPMKTTIQGKKVGYFYGILKIKSCRKNKLKIFTPRRTAKLWILTSVATLEAHRSETGVKTKYYTYRKTKRMILEWFLTTHTAATIQRISIFTLLLPNIRVFF